VVPLALEEMDEKSFRRLSWSGSTAFRVPIIGGERSPVD
jgi:hypothetical protein